MIITISKQIGRISRAGQNSRRINLEQKERGIVGKRGESGCKHEIG